MFIIVNNATTSCNYKNDNKSKPAIYKLYDFSKGRTDINDKKWGFTAVNRNQSAVL